MAELYTEKANWDEVKTIVVEKNALQKNALKSRREIYREISSRLKLLPEELLKSLTHAPISEAKLILLLAISKCYRYITDFIVEVLRNKVLLFDYRLTDFDYQKFFESKYDTHPEMERLTERSHLNVKNMTFSILKQSGLTTGKGERTIQTPIVPRGLMKLICADNPTWLKVFLMPDPDIQYAVKKFT